MTKIQRVTFSLLLVLAACSPKVHNGGYIGEEDIKSEITVGQTTKDQVQDKLGSPSSRSDFGPETWYYIDNRQETWAFMAPEVVKQDVVGIVFDKNGVVSSVQNYNIKDGQQFAMEKKVTPTEGHTFGFFEQLLGNIGRFNNPNPNSDTAAPGRRPGQ